MANHFTEVLSPELRLCIYAYILGFEHPIALPALCRRRIDFPTNEGNVTAVDTSILFVSRLVYREALHVLYSTNTICVPERLLRDPVIPIRSVRLALTSVRSLEIRLDLVPYNTETLLHIIGELFPQLQRVILHASPTQPSQLLHFFLESKRSSSMARVDYTDHGIVSALTKSGPSKSSFIRSGIIKSTKPALSITMRHADFIELAAQVNNPLLFRDEVQMPCTQWPPPQSLDLASPLGTVEFILLMRRRLVEGHADDCCVAPLWEVHEQLRERWPEVGDRGPYGFLFWAVYAIEAFEGAQASRDERGQ